MNKKLLFIAMICLGSITWLKAEDVLTLGNPDFETDWTGLQEYSQSLQKAGKIATDITGWTGDLGNATSVTIYQGPGHNSNHSAVLINTHATGACRFYNNSVVSLSKGSRYKLTFYARGSATIANVSLFQSGKRPTTAEATSGSKGGLYDPEKATNTAIELGNTWTKMEYSYTVPENSEYTDYKLYFVFYKCTKPLADESNLDKAFMIDDIRFTKDDSSGNEQIGYATTSTIQTGKGSLQIRAGEQTRYTVKNLSGIHIASGESTFVQLELPAGLYLVSISGHTQKVIVP